MTELKYLDLPGDRVAYRDVGGGQEVLLLIHGMAGSSETWRAVVPQLSRRYRVIAPDLLGHGQSDKPRGDCSLGAFVVWLHDLLDELEVTRATTVGQSLGGGVAMQFVYQHPDYCQHLLLISSGGLGQDVGWTLRLLSAPGAEFILPRRPHEVAGSIDWLGAAGLAVGLSALLLAITQGQTWGWVPPETVGGVLGGVAVLAGWWWWERHTRRPLVSTAMLTRRPILLTNLATVFVGMGLYFAFLGLTLFVQIPREAASYGFGATVLEASVVYLLPGAFTGFAVALISGRFIDRCGARPVLVVAALAGIVGFCSSRWCTHTPGRSCREHSRQRLHQPRLRRATRAGRGRGGRR